MIDNSLETDESVSEQIDHSTEQNFTQTNEASNIVRSNNQNIVQPSFSRRGRIVKMQKHSEDFVRF